ncbi:vesicle-associated membrane protein 7G [Monocercomonoides exilis]|uniref:vesicle-associated membrane protein 7G n=1 Tax=Monocercomonoides exilis TaxID=2049356 RepID=UPI00355A0EAA|nr:vesicle-associated membrane protein 7G [Monocercomonoides exilis]|eukprot:MONOS_11581.1-p1 / transcript=MONOS_11581.1 / gene=MONOS_11581 / organism=Monocercomonoides_exilis_PA203 / gene_product= vesicle-associated membrane protein 7G / transcript_product= vesicle-associated membrane protein 7G / location=Mono_scaffold00588:34347-35282(-) / protein_length=219 / sequence_SO=supercontig / SO=protein_coding / is_pseudo=false
MPIIYSLIARNTIVLCESSTAKGNFPQVSRTILQKIPATDSKMSYIYEQYTFHYMVKSRICYLCLTEKEFGSREAFAFLSELQRRFTSQYRDGVYSAATNGMREFASQLQQCMNEYSTQSINKLKQVQSDVDELRGVVEQNIDKILVRQEKIELLVDQAEQLNQSAAQFKKKSVGLKKAMWYKNIKLWIIIIVIILILIFVIVVAACGGFTFKNCKKS